MHLGCVGLSEIFHMVWSGDCHRELVNRRELQHSRRWHMVADSSRPRNWQALRLKIANLARLPVALRRRRIGVSCLHPVLCLLGCGSPERLVRTELGAWILQARAQLRRACDYFGRRKRCGSSLPRARKLLGCQPPSTTRKCE